MIGYPVVDVTLDYAQTTIGGASFDGYDWTRLTPFSSYDADDLDLPSRNLVLGISYSYGRDRFITGDFETGLATIVLNNDNGEWSPESGVNTIGGDKLRPGMFVRVGYYLNDSAEDYLDNVTGDTWSGSPSAGNTSRDITDAETASGLFDGRTWTASVNTPGDIELTVDWFDGPTDSRALDMVSWRQIRFMGRILRVEDRYEPGGRGAITVLTVADFLADLSQYHPGALGVARTNENIDTRVTYVFTQGLTDTSLYGNVQTALYDIESSDLPSNYLEEARACARAEGGAVYADHGGYSGKLVFKAANWLLEDPRSATVQAVLGTSRIGIVAASTDYSLSRIFNDLYYTNSSTTVNVSSITSIAAYSTRALRKTVPNFDNTDLDTLAVRDLAILKDPKLVITSVVLHPSNIFEEIFCSTVRIGDLLDVTIENRGWSYQQNLHVSGIAETWDASSGDWTVTLRLDSRDGDTVVS